MQMSTRSGESYLACTESSCDRGHPSSGSSSQTQAATIKILRETIDFNSQSISSMESTITSLSTIIALHASTAKDVVAALRRMLKWAMVSTILLVLAVVVGCQVSWIPAVWLMLLAVFSAGASAHAEYSYIVDLLSVIARSCGELSTEEKPDVI